MILKGSGVNNLKSALVVLGLAGSVAGCEAVNATPLLGTAVANAGLAVPFLPDAGSLLLTGNTLGTNLSKPFLRDGCEKLVDEAAIARCEARNVGPRRVNYRGFPYQ